MNRITFYAFNDELIKIAQEDEVSKTLPTFSGQNPEFMNKNVLKQFLINAGIIGGGLAVGHGLGTLATMGLNKYVMPKLQPNTANLLYKGVRIGSALALPMSILAYRYFADRDLAKAHAQGEKGA